MLGFGFRVSESGGMDTSDSGELIGYVLGSERERERGCGFGLVLVWQKQKEAEREREMTVRVVERPLQLGGVTWRGLIGR